MPYPLLKAGLYVPIRSLRGARPARRPPLPSPSRSELISFRRRQPELGHTSEQLQCSVSSPAMRFGLRAPLDVSMVRMLYSSVLACVRMGACRAQSAFRALTRNLSIAPITDARGGESYSGSQRISFIQSLTSPHAIVEVEGACPCLCRPVSQVAVPSRLASSRPVPSRFVQYSLYSGVLHFSPR